MISIISAFGGQHIQDALYKDMQGQNMVFSLEDCSNGISLIMAVEQHPDVDVIVIGHTVVKDIETYLSQIREITKTARIVLLLNGKRHQYIQEQYEGYNRRYNVEDIIFEGDGIDKLKILSIMNKGRLTVEQEIKEEIHAENPSLAEKPVEKSKENSIENQTGKSDVAEFDIKPEAKPKRPFCTSMLISFFNRNTQEAPKAVPAKGNNNPSNTSIFLSLSCVIIPIFPTD